MTTAAIALPAPLAALPDRQEPRLELEASDPSPVIGAVTAVEVRLRIMGAPPGWGPPRLLASAGKVGPLVAAGADSFLARYELPSGRFPQVALLVAELPPPPSTWPGRPAQQLLSLPLRAPASPAFRTDPGAQVTVQVADRSFGPVIADGSGQVRVTVLVPPGTRTATARSVNSFGKATEQQVDLAPPPFRRLMVLAPPTLQAGATEEIRVAAVSAGGELLDPGRVGLHGSLGRAHPLGGAPGLARFLVRAPASLEARALRLTAVVRGEPETEQEVYIPLRPGPVAQLIIRAERTRLPPKSKQPADVFVIGRDAQGNPAPAGVGRAVRRRPAPPGTAAGGRARAGPGCPTGMPAERWWSRPSCRGPMGARSSRCRSWSAPAGRRCPIPIAASLRGSRCCWRAAAASASVPVWRRWRAGASCRPRSRRGSPWAISAGGFASPMASASRRWRSTRACCWAWRAGAGGPGHGWTSAPSPAPVWRWCRGATGRWATPCGAATGRPALTTGVELALRLTAGAPTLTTRYLYTPLGPMSNGDVYAGNAGGVVFELGYRVGL